MPLSHKTAGFDETGPQPRERGALHRESGIRSPSSILEPLGPGTDPTEDLRQLIDELQAAARNARAELRVVEVERDDLALQLEEALVRVDRLRANERELRSKFVEVTALIRERDTAVAEAKRLSETTQGNNQQYEALVKSRNEAIHQRDEAVRRTEALKRGADEQAALAAEAQKQMLAVRQARDAAHTQCLELSTKIGRAEDRIAELEYDNEAAQKAVQTAVAELSENRRQLDAVVSDRDATAAQVERITAELDEQRRKLLDLSEQKDVASHRGHEHLAALTEARGQVESLTQERDAARARLAELGRELEEIRQQSQTARDAHQHELLATTEKLAITEAQAREFRHESVNLSQQLVAAKVRIESLEQEVESSPARAAAEVQVAAITKEREAALASLEEAVRRAEELAAQRDAIQVQTAQEVASRDEELITLRARIAAAASFEEEAKERAAEAREIAARFEKQRIDTIDIAAQLQSAHREIRELSANLAEARLQVKFAQAATRAVKGSGTRVKAIVSTLTEPCEDEPVPAPRARPLELGTQSALDAKEIKSALGAMRQCYQAFAKHEEDVSLLNELYCHVHAFAERARVSGLTAVHRLAAAFSDFTHGLYQNPVQVNASTMRSVSQTIDFLGTLMKADDPARLRDPAKARVYAVDDDADNCESIKLAMETAMLRTTCALDPIEALSELSEQPCDLIFLDVNMPGMDGFELCSQLRQLPTHAVTPIVFLSGLATVEHRVQSSMSGGTDFIAKPFNLYELTVKALTHILRAQMQGDPEV